MATNKAKRSIHLTQPNPKPAAPAPVKPHVYYTIAELNAGLEKAIHNLHMLQSNGMFGASDLAEMYRALRGIHARANRQLIMALNERETANAAHFQPPRIEPESH
ncbi:MAG: hypothetical protein LAO78_24325 [Acidobacteriia bacterium]|nr:hypothetical protein [Terriglobia bacterium]